MFQFGMKLREYASTKQFSGGCVVTFAQLTGKAERFIARTSSGRASHGKQAISDLCHRAHHHNRPLVQSAADNLRRSVDGRSILHRGATKFHYQHGSKTLAGANRKRNATGVYGGLNEPAIGCGMVAFNSDNLALSAIRH